MRGLYDLVAGSVESPQSACTPNVEVQLVTGQLSVFQMEMCMFVSCNRWHCVPRLMARKIIIALFQPKEY